MFSLRLTQTESPSMYEIKVVLGSSDKPLCSDHSTEMLLTALSHGNI